MMRNEHPLEHVPSGFFALRTPLLPNDLHARWTGAARAPQSSDRELEAVVEADRARLRDGLREVVARPASREAVLVASPSLCADLERWRRDPDGKHGRKVERALVRYFLRMTNRCTPFGLFAGVSVGVMASETRLQLKPRAAYRRAARLDFGLAGDVVEHFTRDRDLRARMRFAPTEGVYAIGDRLRYAEGRRVEGRQIYELSAVVADPATKRVLELARSTATLDALAHALVDEGWTGDLDEAAAFVDALAEHRLLVPAAMPAMTGDKPFASLVRELASAEQGEAASALERVLGGLEQLEATEVGRGLEQHQDVERQLSALGVPTTAGRTLQIDLFKPTLEARLGPRVAEGLERGLDVLRRIVTPVEQQALARFRDRFVSRWEDAEVPLTVALDDELGVWLDAASRPAITRGLPLGQAPTDARPFTQRDRVLLELLLATRARGETTLHLDAAAVASLSPEQLPRLPDAFAVMAKVAARSCEDADAGRYEVLLRSVNGPSGARMLGRFCHGDAELRRWVEKHLRQEEALRPEAVFAEIVHLPEGRLGNILVRPQLRPHEIAYLGRGSTDDDRVLPVDDLMVRVVGSRIILRSRRLDREIVPRLTSAHNYSQRSLGIYRFLCMLQAQDGGSLHFDWGALSGIDFLPRVQHEQIVFSLAQWRLAAEELRSLTSAGTDVDRVRAARRLREHRALPRHVEVHDGDNILPVDLENVMTLETFAHLARSRPFVVVHEPFERLDTLLVEDAEGRYTSEIIVPYVRRPSPEATRPRPVRRAPQHREQRFAPGSRWLYAKLHTGTATADRVLREIVAPLTRDAVARGSARRWFFVRYGDPEWHLRLRIEGDPGILWGEIAPALQQACAPWLADDRIHRLSFDTYVREATRYGGQEGIGLAEEVFFRDSLEVLAMLVGPAAAADERWLHAVAGVHRIFEGLALQVDERLEVLRTWTEQLAREQGAHPGLVPALGVKFRTHRKVVDAILSDARVPGQLADGMRDALTDLRRAALGGRLELPLPQLAASLAHMHCNRLLRSDARVQELVLYDLLARGYRSNRARRARQAALAPLTEVA